ncbi:MAG: phosphoribosylglycinamide formyltransferase [Bacteroidota bacterium]
MKNIAIFASGRGSNALRIIEHFKDTDDVRIRLIVCNKPTAGVLEIAEAHNIPTLLINKTYFYQSENILKDFAIYPIDFIVLAGFLWLIPSYLVQSYRDKIINIHPALLPKYGGKGMYGMHVHKAVYEARDSESGITIHYVNEQYDEGSIIFQKSCPIGPEDGPEDIARKVQSLEHEHFPEIIESLLVPQQQTNE